MIEAIKLVKVFPRATAVNGMSFEVPAGEIYGLLGPNGAGKTTTVRMLAALLRPTSGIARVAGFDVVSDAQEVRRRIGILTEVPGLYERLTPREYLKFFAGVHGLDARRSAARAEELLRLVSLWDRRDHVMRTFSKGTQQRVAIARTLLHDPPVLFFDEPTAALDPEAAANVRDYLAGVASSHKKAVLLCSHNLPEVERLCRRISIVAHGRQVAEGTADELKRGLARPVRVRLGDEPGELVRAVGEIHGVADAVSRDHSILYTTADPVETNPLVVARLVGLGGRVITVEEEPVTLEEVYLTLMRHKGTPA